MSELFIFIVIKLFIIYRKWVIFSINLNHKFYYVNLLKSISQFLVCITQQYLCWPRSFSHIAAPLAFFMFLDIPYPYLTLSFKVSSFLWPRMLWSLYFHLHILFYMIDYFPLFSLSPHATSLERPSQSTLFNAGLLSPLITFTFFYVSYRIYHEMKLFLFTCLFSAYPTVSWKESNGLASLVHWCILCDGTGPGTL